MEALKTSVPQHTFHEAREDEKVKPKCNPGKGDVGRKHELQGDRGTESPWRLGKGLEGGCAPCQGPWSKLEPDRGLPKGPPQDDTLNEPSGALEPLQGFKWLQRVWVGTWDVCIQN